VSRLNSSFIEQATSIVNCWEARHLGRILTTAEAGPLVKAIASKLHAVLDDGLEGCRDRDFLHDAYAVVDAWDGSGKLWHLNAAEAATLAESIAEALEKTCADITQ